MISSNAMSTTLVVPFLLLIFNSIISASGTQASRPLKTYIILVSPPESLVGSLEEWHSSFLPSTLGGERRLVYSYAHTFSGFAARLTEEEVEELRRKDGFVHALPDSVVELDTTYSPTFLGLRQGNSDWLWEKSRYGKGAIIGVVDTGIMPNHPSFDDEEMPPPPPKWRGKCEFNSSFGCNNKVIGAIVFNRGFLAAKGGTNNLTSLSTPLDEFGHGTHVAGIAAGRFVKNANALGQANGTASGMAPSAHLAIYKVCFDENGCYTSDVVAAIESAVRDGVDVISMSLGSRRPLPLYDDLKAMAAFGAMAKGVFVSSAAGNGGPNPSSTVNEAPWMLTVGAGTMNRAIRANVKLGNGIEIKGESLYRPANFSSKLLPLVYPGLTTDTGRFCENKTILEELDVRRKVVLCVSDNKTTAVEKGEVVKKAGGAAMIVYSTETTADAHVLPASAINTGFGEILDYLRGSPNPTSTILFKRTVYDAVAPSVAGFSSRGPSTAAPGILKPDIIAPGLNILAASHEGVNQFRVLWGTSLACPHASGIAALLKSMHPDWSPAMIKSAMMTTTDVSNSVANRILDKVRNRPATSFDIGAGHVNPSRADNPGLVYYLTVSDYVGYLCGLNFTDHNVGAIVQRTVKCAETRKVDAMQLNYPSMYLELGRYKSVEATVGRKVMNVGLANSTYKVKVERPLGVEVEVKPMELRFGKVGDRRYFTVLFTRNETGLSSVGANLKISEGALTWVSTDGKYSVRSVIVINTVD